MKLAIMQPYFFPYIGYWQLLGSVDRFVIYDDVNYIKGGWVNRNRILINGKPSYITAPLYQASYKKRICDISLQSSPVWREMMVTSIENAYRKAPSFSEIFPVIENIIYYETCNLADFLAHLLRTLATFLGINTEFTITSRCYQNSHLTGQDRVLDICKREGATTYINPQGGQALYDTEDFCRMGIDLHFIAMRHVPYTQRTTGFIPCLSVIDSLMEIGPRGVLKHLYEYDLIDNENVHAQ